MKRFLAVIWIAVSWSVIFPSVVWANTIEGIRVGPTAEKTRIVIDVASAVKHEDFMLTTPDRLVLDLRNTTLKAALPMSVSKSKVLTKIRKSTPPEKTTTRLVFELKGKVEFKIFSLAPNAAQKVGHRLVIDLIHPKGNVTPTVAAKSTASKPTVTKSVKTQRQDVLIVIDPGHGGSDPGSIGPTRKYEKNVNLMISKRLVAEINARPGFKAMLTRNGDYFVNLNRRVAIADENRAHLLVSIHADAFTTPQPRGGSVFVLNTRRANTEISRWVENHEKQSEMLGGTGTVLIKDFNDRNVNQTLLDLQFSHSQKEGYKLATAILGEMGKVTRLHNSKPINTSLAVLRSPQIPSVLIETGFISNPTEEKLLFQRDHQSKLARSIAKAIISYVEANPPEDTMVAHRVQGQKHKVARGDYLGKIAAKYGVSVSAIRKANNLKSDSLRVGQELTIPGGSSSASSSASSSSSSSSAAATTSTKQITHVVARGDYLGKIASRYKVSVASIKRENNLRSDTLRLGQKLKITMQVKDIPLRKHKVVRGDFLGKIAAKYGVTVDAIRKANNLRSDGLAVGQVLVIPHK
ncbi:LysM peptidoglycan-binding domain-containing protein [Vibrio sp. 10N.286.49.B3]|uniref:LysM peptidoglycan-binding domain-containing protein n=1 Tax=Vibrio sp. 10N.286.49.B3 TaxID=1880855 RepID=UPI000C86256B|nr:LysM peptidoglycan-binding domain-containing protein [Vibrio sp. 10N.286.49.B3]